jgi:hypothetical protein
LSDISQANASPFALKPKKQLKEDDYCVVEDELDEGLMILISEGVYINLLENPERYTGYAGMSAARVWQSIYQENCFGLSDVKNSLYDAGKCHEEQVFYRLVSGLHSSISVHICGEYLNRKTGVWFKNETCYENRMSNNPERLENMYFLWSVMERAVSKVSTYLKSYPFTEGTEDEAEIKVYSILFRVS